MSARIDPQRLAAIADDPEIVRASLALAHAAEELRQRTAELVGAPVALELVTRAALLALARSDRQQLAAAKAAPVVSLELVRALTPPRRPA